MAENDFEYTIDNDTDLRYIGILGSGAYGSVHEVSSQHFRDSDLGLFYCKKDGVKKESVKLMVVIRKETDISPLSREAVCGERGAGNSKTLWTKNTSQYRSSREPRASLAPSFLLYRYGVMRYEFERFHSPKNAPGPLQNAFTMFR